MKMNEALIYLQESTRPFRQDQNLAWIRTLAAASADDWLRAVDANGFSFLLASLPTGVGLPEAKRVYSQASLCVRRLLLSFRFLMPMHVSAKH